MTREIELYTSVTKTGEKVTKKGEKCDNYLRHELLVKLPDCSRQLVTLDCSYLQWRAMMTGRNTRRTKLWPDSISVLLKTRTRRARLKSVRFVPLSSRLQTRSGYSGYTGYFRYFWIQTAWLDPNSEASNTAITGRRLADQNAGFRVCWGPVCQTLNIDQEHSGTHDTRWANYNQSKLSSGGRWRHGLEEINMPRNIGRRGNTLQRSY